MYVRVVVLDVHKYMYISAHFASIRIRVCSDEALWSKKREFWVLPLRL